MTQEERIAQLEQENAELRAQLAEAYQQINQLAGQYGGPHNQVSFPTKNKIELSHTRVSLLLFHVLLISFMKRTYASNS